MKKHIIPFIIIVFCLMICSCEDKTTEIISNIQTVPEVEISPVGGTFDHAQLVTLTCALDGADIRYTLDGSDPTQRSFQYFNPIIIGKTQLLKVRAFFPGYYYSKISSNQYVINSPVQENMVFVQGGTFMMGSNYSEIFDQPEHSVTVSSFCMNKYEVTQQEWASVMGTNPAYFNNNLNHPVESINWYMTLVYCNKKSALEGLQPVYAKNGETNPDLWGEIPNERDSLWNAITCDWSKNGYRLPTEAEWEFAARGGNLSLGYNYSGSNVVENIAWLYINSGNTTRPVGLKSPNELGIYDMSGNVNEWCWDRYRAYPSEHEINPVGSQSGFSRIYRGGDWNEQNYISVKTRSFELEYSLFYTRGFRVVRRV